MKFSLATLAVVLTGVIAAPAPEPEPVPWCHRPGQGCWKAKRAAEAFAEAIQSSGGLQARNPASDFSNMPGGAAFMAKRGINELANLIALAQDDPEAFYNELDLDGEFDDDNGDDGDDTKEKREAEPEAEPWCHRPGQGCWKREAEDKRWCHRPGQGCWKAKRAAEAVLNVISARDPEALEEKPGFSKREAEPWCHRPGQGCWKREADPVEAEKRWCHRPGQGCWKAKRDILAMRAAANGILNTL